MRVEKTNNSPNFNGMTKILKKRIYIDGKKDISLILQGKKPKNTYAGELPPVIFYALPKTKRTENIHEYTKLLMKYLMRLGNFAQAYKGRQMNILTDAQNLLLRSWKICLSNLGY